MWQCKKSRSAFDGQKKKSVSACPTIDHDLSQERPQGSSRQTVRMEQSRGEEDTMAKIIDVIA